MERVVVVGGPGSGKTTVARRLADALEADHVELDALWWGPNWTSVGRDELRSRVSARVSASARWVVDGYYLDELAEILWPLADTLVWLDLPRRVGFRRTVLRTIRRITEKELLWQTNRQSIRDLSPRSLFRLWRRWPQYPAEIEARVRSVSGPSRVKLRSRGEVERWLSSQ